MLGGEWIAGAPQTGIAAQFKTRTLTGFVAGAPHTLMGFVAEQHVGKQLGCLDVGLTHLLKPGRKITQRAVWTEWPHVPTPGVPVDLVATFPFAGRGEAHTESDDRPIEVHLASAILDGEPWPWMTPAQAVDAALADPVFAAWLAEEPAASWINPSITLDADAGTWTIGLFRDALGGAHGWAGQVTMDAVTGTVISHRFE